METLNLSDIYNQNLTQFYLAFNDCWTVVELFCVPIMMFIVGKKSPPSMNAIKWQMLYHLSICALYNFLLGLWKPVPLFPLYLGYSAGPIRIFGTPGAYFMMESMVSIALLMAASLMFRIVYRYAQVLPGTFMYYWLNNRKRAICIFVLINLIPQLGLTSWMCLSRPNFGSFRNLTISIAPVTAEFFNNTANFGYDPTLNQFIYVFYIFCVVFDCIVTIELFVLILTFIPQLKSRRRSLSEYTYKHNKMLFKSLTMEVFILFAFLFFPLLIAIVCLLFRVKHGSFIAIFCIMSSRFQMVAECFVILYFITPYRMYIAKFFFRLKHTKTTPITNTHVNPANLTYIELIQKYEPRIKLHI